MTERDDITTSDVIETEALAWIAQLDGDGFTREDLDAFSEWVSRSPAHARIIRELNGFWGELNVLVDDAESIRKAGRVRAELPSRTRNVFRPILAASLLACVFAGWMLRPSTSQEPDIVAEAAETTPRALSTAVGEQGRHVLPDGSRLTLNTRSTVEVLYTPSRRHVMLKEGEAWFNIEPDPDRPFTVVAGDGLVRAIGTVFSVRLDDDRVNVVVTEGAVGVGRIADGEPLNVVDASTLAVVPVGHEARIDREGAKVAELPAAALSSRLSWQEGYVTFAGETLEEVVREVGRYTELRIVIEDEELRSIRFGGIFRTGDVDALFSSLQTGFDISADRSEPGTVRLSRD